MKRLFTSIFTTLLVLSCSGGSFYDDPDSWISVPGGCCPNDSAVVYGCDVLYFVSTEVMQSRTPDGEISYRSLLTSEDRSVMMREARFAQRRIFPDSLNFFSPFYHQFTAEIFDGPTPEERRSITDEVEKEAVGAFRYYMKHVNQGRPFILAGFSQGGMMVKAVLRSMDSRQYRSLVAAYVIGSGLDDRDMRHRFVVAAKDGTSTGVCVSFNSVASRTPGTASVERIMTLYSDPPVTCINPVNWRTDAEPASLVLPWKDSLEVTVAVDTVLHVLTVTGYDDYTKSPLWPDGCMHHEDLTIYTSNIRRNALDRARTFSEVSHLLIK